MQKNCNIYTVSQKDIHPDINNYITYVFVTVTVSYAASWLECKNVLLLFTALLNYAEKCTSSVA